MTAVALVVSEYHAFITDGLETGARGALAEAGWADEEVETFEVPLVGFDTEFRDEELSWNVVLVDVWRLPAEDPMDPLGERLVDSAFPTIRKKRDGQLELTLNLDPGDDHIAVRLRSIADASVGDIVEFSR